MEGEHIEQAIEHVEAAANDKAVAVAEAAQRRIDEAQKTAEAVALSAAQASHMQALENLRKEHETWRASDQDHRMTLERRLAESEAKLTSILQKLAEAPAVVVAPVEKMAQPVAETTAKDAHPDQKTRRVRRFL